MNKRTSRVYLSSRVTPDSGAKTPKDVVTSAVLRKTAQAMAPFYRKIAFDEQYAHQWSKAVVEQDQKQLQLLLKKASPGIGKNQSGTTGTGYFISLPFPAPVEQYASGTAIPTGSAKLVFEPGAHRAVAAAVYPFYRFLAANTSFASTLARAIQEQDPEAAAGLVRKRVSDKSLKSVATSTSGLVLSFRFKFSQYSYRNLLFRDVK